MAKDYCQDLPQMETQGLAQNEHSRDPELVREGDKPQKAEQLKKDEERGYTDTNSLPWKEMLKAKTDKLCHPNPGTVLTTESF